jgi:hypothetical protein
LELEALEDRTLLSGGTGLTGQYFATQSLSSLKVTRTDPSLNFDWGYDQSPVAGVPGDHFSVKWTGYVQPLYSQVYTFYTQSDDGVRVSVNGQLIINNWSNHTAETNTGSIRLVAGQKYKIEVDYYQNTGDAQLQLMWSSASQAKQIIPTSQLFPSATAPVANLGPSTKLSAGNVNTANGTSYTFTVTYTDSSEVVASSLKTDNVRVYGPNNFSAIATLVKLSQSTNGTSITATYSFTPPGGKWDSTDNGTYSLYLLANQVKDVKGVYASPRLLGNFQVTAPAADWFSTHLQTPALQNEVRSLDADHSLSYSDMEAIFSTVEKAGNISTTELNDLKTLVANSAYLGMPAYVENLASKVIDGDPANATYLGHSLGNLHINSSSVQLQDLVGKWFLGTDLPSANGNTHYVVAKGTLFGSGPSYTNIVQGELGDCYFLAGLGEAALRDSSAIKSMFISDGNGIYTVRFYQPNGQATYVTVNSELPVTSNGTFWYANFQASAGNSANVLWVALAEKAYAQLAQSGWSRPGSTADSYSSINLGWEGDAVHQITGKAEQYNAIVPTLATENAIISAFNSGRMIGMDSKATTAPQVVANHVYIMVGYNPSTKMVSMYNPWGAIQVMTWMQIGQNFQGWSENLS